jgi:TFIIF-interacting CTD phosphatase-like protein
MTDTVDDRITNRDAREAEARDIRLPSGSYQVQTWKVRPGAAVRRGETLALLVHKSSSVQGELTASPAKEESKPIAPQHKRPSKRRRPGAAAAVAAVEDPSTGGRAGGAKETTAVSSTTTAALLKSVNASSGTPSSDRLASNQTRPMDGTTPLLAPADGLLQLNDRTSFVNAPKDNSDSSSRSPATSDDPLVLGMIIPCNHPTVVDGLCVVCGQKAAAKPPSSLPEALMQQQDQDSSHKPAMLHDTTGATRTKNTSDPNLVRVTLSGGVTLTISAQEGQRMAQHEAQRLHQQKKLSLVLDLDHTLLHATNDARAQRHLHRRDVRTLVLPVVWEGQPPPQSTPHKAPPTLWMQHFVKLRPHLHTFLQTVRQWYEVGVYTAGTRPYAEQITLLLARHLMDEEDKADEEDKNKTSDDDVDSERDPIADDRHIEWMRQRMEACQEKIRSLERKVEDQETEEQQKGHLEPRGAESTKDSSLDAASTGVIISENPTDEPKKTGKRKVRFGDTAERTDEQTPLQALAHWQDQLTRHRTALSQAQARQQAALEMRQRLFGTRIVSRTDVADLGSNVKSLKRIFPCGGNMAVVVDDREDVWANASDNATAGEPPDNVLLVRPYHWKPFAGFAEVNNASGDDYGVAKEAGKKESSNEPASENAEKGNIEKGKNGESSGDDDDDDRQLLWTMEALRRIHEAYYETRASDPQPGRRTVPEIVRDMRSQILKGSQIVLSGIVPLHRQQPSSSRNRPRHPFVRYAETLGAILTPNVTPTVTHVVANRNGTDKILAAHQVQGCQVVKPLWLIECVWRFSRTEEGPYLWPKGKICASTDTFDHRTRCSRSGGGGRH